MSGVKEMAKGAVAGKAGATLMPSVPSAVSTPTLTDAGQEEPKFLMFTVICPSAKRRTSKCATPRVLFTVIPSNCTTKAPSRGLSTETRVLAVQRRSSQKGATTPFG
jgi:hypothetical protein